MEWISGPSHKILSHSFNHGQGRKQRGEKKTGSKHKEADDQRVKARGSFLKNRLQVRRTRKEREGAEVDVRKREVKR